MTMENAAVHKYENAADDQNYSSTYAGSYPYPAFFKNCMVSLDDAMKMTVKSGSSFTSGFATSEPHTFYANLWDFIQKENITNLTIHQALFMSGHKICVGNALESRGLFPDISKKNTALGRMAKKVNPVTQQLQGLDRLMNHYRELIERHIVIKSPFIGAATNKVIPANFYTRLRYGELAGRNTTRMGITDMQSVHFSDAVDSMAIDPDGRPKSDTWIMVMTPPDERGDLSHGPANGANGEIIERLFHTERMKLLLFINPAYPFTRGYKDAPNTVNIRQFEKLANEGRLIVVMDHGKIPALPAGNFSNPDAAELAIAKNIVNHIEMNKHLTYGRAIQVGIGGVGVQAIRLLRDTNWHGRIYTEMLEPFTMDLFESGKVSGSHFIERDGTRTQLDDKVVCTFTMGEDGSNFYSRIHNNPAIVMATASRVVIPEGFHRGLGINNCLSIDFHGHVNSGGRDQNHFSGVGGGAVIFRGLANSGIGYLCLKSTHRLPEGTLRSSIFPFMPSGTPISHIGPDLAGGRYGARFYVVTEHGVAQVSGKSQSEFIKSLIGIADPRFRKWLKKEAWREFRISC